jgi:uncharacterized protein YecE (DUF72 family)
VKKGKSYIGTSGWHYKHWKGIFYPEGTPEKSQLDFYVRTFHTVELNNSFYRLPSAETFAKWKNTVPEHFLFSVKGSRFITHLKKLNVNHAQVHEFLDNADKLGKKLGPVLFQLPPRWNVNPERLEDFLKLLPQKHRYVFEFRNESWYIPEMYNLLHQHNCAFCIYELGGHRSPEEITADFVYIRLHGPGNKYEGSYTTAALKKWAHKCSLWLDAGKDVFIYFDNDQLAYAPKNAASLKKMLQEN